MKLKFPRARRRATTIGIYSGVLMLVVTGSAVGANKAAQVRGYQIVDASVTSVDLKDGTIGWVDLSAGTRSKINRAIARANVPGSANSAVPAPAATNGTNGKDGINGANGLNGANGSDGTDAPAAEYGLGALWISRGGGAYSAWGTFPSAAIPAVSHIAAQSGGEIRFTCTVAQAPCRLALTGVVASDTSTAPAKVQAHLLLEKAGKANAAGSGLEATGTIFCEAGEVGSQTVPATTDRIPLAQDPFKSIGNRLAIDIGGSADCDQAQIDLGAANGIQVQEYEVPAGYYNARVTFRFHRA